MNELKLIEKRPFMNNGVWTYPKLGTIFEVIEEKQMPIIGLMYKIRYKNFPTLKIEGFHKPDSFQNIKASEKEDE